MRVDGFLAAHDPHEHLAHVSLELCVGFEHVAPFLVAAAVRIVEGVYVLLRHLSVHAPVVLVEGVELVSGELGVVDAPGLVVYLALVDVAEDAVDLLECLELFRGVWVVGVLVGVELQRHAMVRLLNLGRRGILGDADGLVEALAVEPVVVGGVRGGIVVGVLVVAHRACAVSSDLRCDLKSCKQASRQLLCRSEGSDCSTPAGSDTPGRARTGGAIGHEPDVLAGEETVDGPR